MIPNCGYKCTDELRLFVLAVVKKNINKKPLKRNTVKHFMDFCLWFFSLGFGKKYKYKEITKSWRVMLKYGEYNQEVG